MWKKLLKNIKIAFLLFIIAGATLFCLSFTEAGMVGHGMGDTPITNGAMHALYMQGLSSTVVGVASFLMMGALLLLLMILDNSVIGAMTIFIRRRIHQNDRSTIKNKLSRWLSIFERSPNIVIVA